MPDAETLIAARRERWNGWEQPTTALDEIDQRRYHLVGDIEAAEATVRAVSLELADAQRRLESLLTRREQYDALEAEMAAARLQRTHATYVAREPVVILSSGAGE